MRLHRLVWVHTCQNVKLLEISRRGSIYYFNYKIKSYSVLDKDIYADDKTDDICLFGATATDVAALFQGLFCPSLEAEFRPHSQSKIATFFPNTMSDFPN